MADSCWYCNTIYLSETILDGESGIEWFDLEREALQAFHDAVDSVEWF